MVELAKTTAGRQRISAATDRMDRTVGKLGQQFRHDVPQGENGGVELRQPEAPPQFISTPSHTPGIAEYRDDRESREVPFPADEPGGGKTHDFEGSLPENHGPAGLGMDVAAIYYKPETDLKELFTGTTRDVRAEIAEEEREIIAVIWSQRAVKRVVSEIYSPPPRRGRHQVPAGAATVQCR